MKVLYIGCYRDGTGWAHAAQNYILSLDTAGVEVVPRFIKLNSNQVEIPKRISDLEKNDDKNCDVVIQHVLPHQLSFNGNFEKNISLYVSETDHFQNTCWPERISLMDEAWVPNSFMAESVSKNSKIISPHYIIPHAADMSKYQKQYEPFDIPFFRDKFVFYFIGEINRRKNIGSLLKAFHTEFRPEEDVAIFLKAHLPGQSSNDSQNYLRELSENVKNGLKLYQSNSMYHEEIFICDYLSDEQIMRIHATGDCFVSGSFGEAWCIPAFDAMSMGKTPICTDTGGPRDFIGDGGYLIESRKENCFGVIDAFDELYVANESWDAPSIPHMRQLMRRVFENEQDRKEKSSNGISRSYDYSYSAIGEIMLSTLSGKSKSFNVENNIKQKQNIENLLKCQD
jgi:glycosyltransferase involved in cell wall biosynthesis